MIFINCLVSLSILCSTIYVDSDRGNDSYTGTSPTSAWKSLDRVSKASLAPGTNIVLTSGCVFAGHLDLHMGGSKDQPIVVRSENPPAKILSVDSPAIVVRVGGIEIRNLALTGGATSGRNGHCGVRLIAPTGRRSKHIRLERLDISGFGDSGISIEAAPKSFDGFDDLQISKAKIHRNFGTGIMSFDDVAFSKGRYAHRNLKISDCDISGNFGGNGVVLSGVDGAVVEYSRSTDNHGEKGALGMWAWCAKHVVFRYCIANGIRGTSDSGGFDLDGGCKECLVEHCLSFDNLGPGYMHCDFPDAPRTERNVFRGCASINDGRAASGGPIGFGFVVWGSGLYNCTIDHNLAVITKESISNRIGGVLFANFIRYDKMPITNQRLVNALFKRNTIAIDAPGTALYTNNFPARNPADVSFVRNTYLINALAPIIEEEHRYETVEQWQIGVRNNTGNSANFPVHPAIGGYSDIEPRDLPKFLRRLGL